MGCKLMQKRLDAIDNINCSLTKSEKLAILQKLSEENRSAPMGSTLTAWEVFFVIFLHIVVIVACYAFDTLI